MANPRKYCHRCLRETSRLKIGGGCSRCASLFNRYKLRAEAKRLMEEEQNGLCKICGKPPAKRGLFVDHDHSNGRVRGLLCTRCNAGIGWLCSTEILRKAIAYITTADASQHQTRRQPKPEIGYMAQTYALEFRDNSQRNLASELECRYLKLSKD